MDLNVGSSLALKFKSLGEQVDDLDFLLGAVKRRIHIPAHGNVIRRPEAVGLPARWLPLAQIDVADATGLSVVHVNRKIQMLRSLNVLSRAGHAIEVVDRTQLANIAEFDGRYLGLPELASKWTVQVQ